MPPDEPATKAPDVVLLYDAECPICDAYCRLVRIRADAGTLVQVDARGDSDVKDELTRRGLDVDQGMALKVGGTLYYGADAIEALAALSSRDGLFGRLSHWLFGSAARARVLYPVFRSARNLLLKVLGRTRINNLGIAGVRRF